MNYSNFPVGYQDFHSDIGFNYSLNRWYSLGFTDAKEIRVVSKDINTFEDWEKIMKRLAEKAELENRLMAAAFYWRAAEFYVKADRIAQKKEYYQKFLQLFDASTEHMGYERDNVPYQKKYLRTIRFPAKELKKSPIVLHGGFD